jgi:polysaccharide biosynthesis/export protein
VTVSTFGASNQGRSKKIEVRRSLESYPGQARLQKVGMKTAFIRLLGSRVVRIVSMFAALSFANSATLAQNQRSASIPSSDLGRDNLSRVAASATELKAVLIKDPGLMVELKRWVAKDATDHGQVISDSDLTNDAIFERLENDSQFRSLATATVQKYGYLLPRVNPDSELGKERELLIQERTKWLAQRQEEELAAARQRNVRNRENAQDCDSRSEANCQASQSNSSTNRNGFQGSQGTQGPSPNGNPQPSTPPSTPRDNPYPQERDRLMQANESPSNNFPADEPADRYDPSSSSNGIAQNADGSSGNPLPQLMGNGDDRQSDSQFSRGSAQKRDDGNPPLTNGPGSNGANQSLGSPGQDSGREQNQYVPYGMSPVVPVQQSTRRYRQNAQIEPVEMVRAQNPYINIPSLYDMYLQAVTRPATPRRFGSEVFENGTRDPQLIPMDLPVGPDYVVGPGDGLSIDLWGGISQRFFRTVDREGRISLPEAGPVLVSGKTLADVQQNLQQILRTQFRDVSTEVSLARLRTIRIYEVGEVANPGAYDISSLSTPLNALFAAGGPTSRGSLRIVKHYRGDQFVQAVDLYDLLLRGVKGDMARLDNGDTILVPPIGPQVTVEGMVRRPAIYELKDEKTLADVLELAGGLLPTAALRHIEVQRLVAHDKQTMLSLDIPDAGDSSEVTKKLEGFEIRDGDRVRIFPIAPYNQDAIYLDGHVLRPGRYSYRENMRVTDLIGSYKDLLPEPATDYAEIIRLNTPDFHPTVESFDLAVALADPAQSPVLHAMDTVRIFSKFDFENPPAVSVWGDVRDPGTYRTSGQIRLGDAIRLAGGLAPDAQKEDAQVFRYLPDGKFKIFSVNLTQALAGDPTENILLQPRDRLLIHRNPDAVEPATVYIQGEVARPGRYPLTTNMNVSELIQVGGGLKPSADTVSADLTHLQYNGQMILTGQHESISISAALSNGPEATIPIRNGDTLTIRQLAGWNDLGASIRVLGEVKNPGTYGIRPGEKLSSILERAGGFQPSAYPYGAVLRRVQVRELEVRDQDQMILRVKDEQSNLELLPETDPEKKRAKDTALQQWQTALEQLSSNPPSGRVAIRISPEIEQWKNTIADVEVRAGDYIEIPKKPSFIMITGQVYNPTAVSYRRGKSARWYLSQGGGPTQLADKKAIFVIRGDGSVLGSRQGLWSGDSLSAELRPGDTVVVPERAIGGGVQWQTVFLAAQVASSIASTAFIAAHY